MGRTTRRNSSREGAPRGTKGRRTKSSGLLRKVLCVVVHATRRRKMDTKWPQNGHNPREGKFQVKFPLSWA